MPKLTDKLELSKTDLDAILGMGLMPHSLFQQASDHGLIIGIVDRGNSKNLHIQPLLVLLPGYREPGLPGPLEEVDVLKMLQTVADAGVGALRLQIVKPVGLFTDMRIDA